MDLCQTFISIRKMANTRRKYDINVGDSVDTDYGYGRIIAIDRLENHCTVELECYFMDVFGEYVDTMVLSLKSVKVLENEY